jgi:hypothetical protein
MFGRSKPVVIDRYSSRSRTRVPRWLWPLSFGAALGAGAVVYVQEKHLPPRLTTEESGRLKAALGTAEAERSSLSAALAESQRQLQAAQAEQQRAAAEVAGSTRERAGLRHSIEALLAALPADPRGSAVEVRSGRFKVEGTKLGFEVVLSRARSEAPFTGVLQFTVAGTTERGAGATVDLQPVAVTVGRFEIASGDVPMPAGFTPREATLRVLDGAGGKAMGMRVFLVK